MNDIVPSGAERAPPSTPAEASTRLAAAKADPVWTKALDAGGRKEFSEFKSLHELIDRGDNVDMAIAGQLAPGVIQSSDHIQDIGVAKWLRDAGLGPDVQKQVLNNEPVAKDEFDKAGPAKVRLMENSEFTKALSAGDGAAKRSLRLLNIILSSDVRTQ